MRALFAAGLLIIAAGCQKADNPSAVTSTVTASVQGFTKAALNYGESAIQMFWRRKTP